MVMGMVTERDGHRGRTGTRNGEMEGPARAGRAAEEEDENWYVCRGCVELLGGGMRERKLIRFGAYNNCSSRNSGMESSLRGML